MYPALARVLRGSQTIRLVPDPRAANDSPLGSNNPSVSLLVSIDPVHARVPAGKAPAPTLRELSDSAAKGDHAAFQAIHDRIGSGLRRLLLKRSGGREDLVDDLTQRTWANVYAALRQGKYDPSRSAITTFVYAVANNAWLTHLRTFARRQGYLGDGPRMEEEGPLEHAADTADAPALAAAHAEILQVVRDCLREDSVAGLSAPEREVVTAIAAGESDRGLARRLGCSSSTVNVRKHSAYNKIRAHLSSKGLIEAAEVLGLSFDESAEPTGRVP